MSKEAIEHYEAALKEAFPSGATGNVFHHWNEARKALAEQPAQVAEPRKQQEPFGYFRYDLRLDAWVQNREGRPGTAFYTSPPQRTWVGLTDDEILYCVELENPKAIAEEVEAKLRERNT